jgi:hypothetical protein
VLAMRDRLGLSYQEAAHRLFMTEVEKFRIQKEAENGFRALRQRLDKTITLEICPALEKLDGDAGKKADQ